MLQGGYSYSGQRCTAVKVVLVAEEVADELVAKVKKGVEGLSVGMPEVCALFSNPMDCQELLQIHASTFMRSRIADKLHVSEPFCSHAQGACSAFGTPQ